MKKSNPKVTVVISYNNVGGFKSGWHKCRTLFVCANDAGHATDTGSGNSDSERAGGVMHRISGQYYHGAVPVEKVRHFYIYAGLYAFTQALEIAKSLKTRSEAPVTVVACKCQMSEKEAILRGTGIDILRSECGGIATLGRLCEDAGS